MGPPEAILNGFEVVWGSIWGGFWIGLDGFGIDLGAFARFFSSFLQVSL